jgi:hypothetical protein
VDNDGERDAAIQELRRIGAISKCSSEISNIVGIAQTQHPEKITLIDLYIRMIAAIQAEEYRRAVEIKREIQATAS